MSAAPRHLIVVPAWNESGSIREVVNELRQHLPEADILVIDDGSTDATLDRVPPCATVVSLPFNLGIGVAVQTGFRYAAMHGYDVAIQVDADGQHPAREVHKLLEPLARGEADMVVGSRFLDARGPEGFRQSATRMAGIRVLSLLLRLLTGSRFTDCTSGFRAVNRPVIRAFSHWYPDDYPEPEVILLLQRAGFRVVEVPVRMKPRAAGRSSIPLLRGLFYVIKVSVALVLDTMRRPWPKGRLTP